MSENIIPLAVLVILIGACFYKTIFCGQAISKLAMTEQVDALFNPDIKQEMVKYDCDPSSFQHFFPTAHFAEKSFSEGNLPLWNPDNGLGFPLIGDIQSHIFSPFHLLGVFTTVSSYEFYLVGKVALAALSTFALSRMLGVSPFGALFAATAFAFNPVIFGLVHLENHESLFPVLGIVFVWLSRNPTVLRCGLTGLTCAGAIAAMHPEPAFFAIGFGACLTIALMKDRIARALATIGITAVFSFLFAAPILLPFAEFFGSCNLYKDVASAHQPFVPLNQFFYHALFSPNGKAAFLGALTLVLAPLALWRARVLWCICLLAVLITFPFGPILSLFNLKPFTFLAVGYGQPEVMLLLAILGGFGLDRLCLSVSERALLPRMLILTLAIGIITIGLFANLSSLTGDVISAGGPNIVLAALRQNHFALQSTAFVLFGAMALIALANQVCKLHRQLLPIIIIVLNVCSLLLVAKRVLPSHPRFDYPTPPAVAFVQSENSRVGAAGDHFFLPNSNLLFGLNDCRNFNPFTIKRYQEFFNSHGYGEGKWFSFNFPERIDHAADVCSISHIVTREGLTSIDDSAASPGCTGLQAISQGRLTFGLRLKQANLYYDKVNQQVCGELLLRAHGNVSNRYSAQFVVLNESDLAVWSGPRKLLRSEKNDHLLRWPVAVPISTRLPSGSKLRIAVNLFDSWTGLPVVIDGSGAHQEGTSVLLAAISTATSVCADRHLVLVKENADGTRVYKNRLALPRAYFVADPIIAASTDEALKRITDLDFDIRRTAVIEDPAPSVKVSTSNPAVSQGQVSILQRNGNSFVLACRSAVPGYVVITDMHYPGWKASLDGKPVPIAVGNYIFKSIAMPAGTHKIELNFLPDSFVFGLNLFGVALVVLLGSLLRALWFLGRQSHNQAKQ